MRKINVVSTKPIVKTGIAELDKEIGGLFIGERSIIFGAAKEGVELFITLVKKDCNISPDPCSGFPSGVECRTGRTIFVAECTERKDLPSKICDIAENIFQIRERNGKHYVYVWKNRMKGIYDFECEIK